MIGIASYLVSSPRRIIGVLVVSATVVAATQFAPIFDGSSPAPTAPGVVQGASAQLVVPQSVSSPLYAELFALPRDLPEVPERSAMATANAGGDGAPVFSQPSDPPAAAEPETVVEVEVAVPGQQGAMLLLRPTFSWVNVFGDSSTLNGEPLQPGDVVTAFDPGGTLVGRTTVVSEGNFGLMALYQDDPATAVDEGADPGDEIRFEINGVPAVALGPHAPIWSSNGSIIMSNLAAAS